MSTNTESGEGASRGWTFAVSLVWAGLVVFWVAMMVYMVQATGRRLGPLPLWGVCALAMVLLLALAGREINGRWLGILIDARNKISLSRLQITLWTIMILSAFLMVAVPRIDAMVHGTRRLTQEQALDIAFPEELLLAMGISAASFAGANLINNNKKGKRLVIAGRSTPDDLEARRDEAKKGFDDAVTALDKANREEQQQKEKLQQAKQEFDAAPGDPLKKQDWDQAETRHKLKEREKDDALKAHDAKKEALAAAEKELTAAKEAQGLLHKNASPSEASWIDLFRGEEIGNYRIVDMSKVQMLFFTVIVVATYAAALAAQLHDLAKLKTAANFEFPAFSNTLNALLGISHATYLSVKTIDKT